MIEITSDLPEFRSRLLAISGDFRRRAVRQGLSAAGRILRDAAKPLAPVLRPFNRRRVAGALQRNIIIKRSQFQKAGAERYFVGVRSGRKAQRRGGGDPFYWRFLEGGWMPRGPGNKLRGGTRSRNLQRQRLRDAGAKFVKIDFLKPAFDRNKARALTAFSAQLDRAITRYSKAMK